MIEKSDNTSKILHRSNPLDAVRDPETSDIMLTFLSMFYRCPQNYYDYKDIVILKT